MDCASGLLPPLAVCCPRQHHRLSISDGDRPKQLIQGPLRSQNQLNVPPTTQTGQIQPAQPDRAAGSPPESIDWAPLEGPSVRIHALEQRTYVLPRVEGGNMPTPYLTIDSHAATTTSTPHAGPSPPGGPGAASTDGRLPAPRRHAVHSAREGITMPTAQQRRTTRPPQPCPATIDTAGGRGRGGGLRGRGGL